MSANKKDSGTWEITKDWRRICSLLQSVISSICGTVEGAVGTGLAPVDSTIDLL